MTSEAQLNMFAATPHVDELAARLESLGLAPSRWALETNRTLGEWGTGKDTPSRLFHFPIEFMAGDRRDDGVSKLLLNHPLIGSHPFVQLVESKLGERIEWEPHDEFGRDRGARWRYFHALDLATNDLYPRLLATAEFVDGDDRAIAAGVGYGVRYGSISPGRARFVLLSFGLEEHEDRSAAALHKGIIRPDPIYADDNGKPTKKPRYGMNPGYRHDEHDAMAMTWAILHGLEDGTFKIPKGGHLTMTPAGLERLAHLIRKRDVAGA